MLLQKIATKDSYNDGYTNKAIPAKKCGANLAIFPSFA